MKYIIGFIVILLAVLALYTMGGGNIPSVEAPNTLNTANDTISSEDVLPPTNAEGEQDMGTQEDTINNTNKKETMQEQTNAITKATLKTNQGDITLEFFNDLAPATVANFVKLAGEGFYDGVKFHRVIKGFMIQGGDPLSKDDAQAARWGTGGPGYAFEDEIHASNANNKYTISMANSGPNTNGSQFFINTADNNFLDTKHTVFGKVTLGTDTVDAIEGTQTLPGDRPVEAQVIESIVLE
jgi:peptidylprolyl isomerase